MPDRLTIVEEMREQERKLDRDVERIMAAAPRCPVHGTPFVAGVGIGDQFFAFGPGGGCAECFWKERSHA